MRASQAFNAGSIPVTRSNKKTPDISGVFLLLADGNTPLASKFAAVAWRFPCSLRCCKELADKKARFLAFLLSVPVTRRSLIKSH